MQQVVQWRYPVLRTLLLAGLAGWLTSAIYLLATNTHYFSLEERAFLSDAAVTSNYELQGAQLMQQLATREDVRTEARQAETEQLRFADEMKLAVARRDPTFRWPSGIDGSHQRMLARLGRTGAESEYRRQMISAHLMTQVRNREYLNRRSMDRKVRDIITRSMPAVERELQRAMALAVK